MVCGERKAARMGLGLWMKSKHTTSALIIQSKPFNHLATFKNR